MLIMIAPSKVLSNHTVKDMRVPSRKTSMLSGTKILSISDIELRIELIHL